MICLCDIMFGYANLKKKKKKVACNESEFQFRLEAARELRVAFKKGIIGNKRPSEIQD